MKKMIALLIVLALVVACVGCRADDDTKIRDALVETREHSPHKNYENTPAETQEVTQPETQPVTEPETQAVTEPATEKVTEPEPQEQVQSGSEKNEYAYFSTVEKLLDKGGLSRTAVPVSNGNIDPDGGGKLQPMFLESAGGAFVQSCLDRAVNPVAAYRYLVNKGVFVRTTTDPKPLELCLVYETFASPLCTETVTVSAQTYSYDLDGCQQLMRDVILLAGFLNEGTVYEGWLTESSESGLPEIHYAEDDECYYGYYIYYDELGANVMCVYIRSGDGRTITDLEFQMLNLDYYLAEPSAGFSISLGMRRVADDSRIAAMIVAAEELLTGRTGLDTPDDTDVHEWETTLPMSYRLGKWSVKVHTICYTSTMDVEDWMYEFLTAEDTIINYRISK